VRALELTLSPEGGPVEVVGARATRRTRGFTVAYHQESPTSPVKVVLVSLEGRAIAAGRGPVVRLAVKRGARHARLRLSEGLVAR
jgi:hypothetical protein